MLAAAPQPLSVVLDAANLCWAFVKAQPGWAHAASAAGLRPPVSGLVVCIEFFKSYGVSPVAICPTWWTRTKDQGVWGDPAWEAQDFARLQTLQQEGLLFASPSGEHDDLYIIDYCFRTDGFLVSNDKYRDHRRERNLDPDWIEARRVGFMFVRDTFIPNPDHILRLEEFVRQTGKVVGNSGAAGHRSDLLPPPPPTQDLAELRRQHHAGVGAAEAPPPVQRYPTQGGEHDVRMGAGGGHSAHGAEAAQEEILDFPKAGLGFLIGKGGAKISEIRADSGASVEIRDAVVDADGNARVVIAGSDAARGLARSAVMEMREVALRKLGRDARVRSSSPAVPSSSHSQATASPSRLARGDPVGMGHHNAAGYERRLASLQQQNQSQHATHDHMDHVMQDSHDDMHDDLL